MKRIFADGVREYKLIEEMKKREEGVNLEVAAAVEKIIREVKDHGDLAVRKYCMNFDGACPDNFEVEKDEIQKAYNNSDIAFRQALINAKKNIEEYHREQCPSDYRINRDNGAVLGQITRGMKRVGIYVPGGTAAYPSTVLMNAIPAKLAGVEEIVMITPPLIEEKDGNKACSANPDILTAAYIAGVDRIFLAGGAQAIAALAYGTESIPKAEKIVGPGNIYVAAAKRLVFGQVDIDMIAGPSEILILADEEADPRFIAADLISQAEHDRMAASVLITTSAGVADAVMGELDRQIRLLDRQEIIRAALNSHGAVIICRSADEMIDLANEIAPEHLEIMMKEPLTVLGSIRNAGSVFCGDYSPEPLGDYFSGTNHVLPTSGTARFASPLGVYSFVKRMSYTCYSREALEHAKDHILEISRREGLAAHGRSVEIRFDR